MPITFLEQHIASSVTVDVALLPLHKIRWMRQPWAPGKARNRSGVYFLFLGFHLTYIGQSKELAARLRAHAMNRVDRKARYIPFDLWTALDVPEHGLDEVEDFYIAEYQPPFNLKGVVC